ncbi:hypothetical protein QJS10_CPB14g01270 [Acorus calamus]|uniref:Bulb-type lectin domain-containing protein n=1 Tax=Acorus calamus TaxID=4465 RepID=A0AAV9DAG8_ACOCL|nr:hypothetical protein QJS10_CPB14g01270 [Acorus calamus]
MASPPSTNALSISLIFAMAIMLSLVGENCEAASSNVLFSGDSLNAGQALNYGNYTFIMQSDCNLVLFDGGRAIWASNTAGQGSSCVLTMQYDANLVIYNTAGSPVWSSKTSRGRGNYLCVLQNDRNVVIYGIAFWAIGSEFAGVGVTILPAEANHTSPAVVNGGGGGH